MVCLIGLRNRAQRAMAMDWSALNRACLARVKAGFLSIHHTSIVPTVEVLASVRKAMLTLSLLIAMYAMAEGGLRACPSLEQTRVPFLSLIDIWNPGGV